MSASPSIPNVSEKDFNIEKYYTKTKYKYRYILESVRLFYIKGCRGRSGLLKELRYIKRRKITQKTQNETIRHNKTKPRRRFCRFVFENNV